MERSEEGVKSWILGFLETVRRQARLRMARSKRVMHKHCGGERDGDDGWRTQAFNAPAAVRSVQICGAGLMHGRQRTTTIGT
jgi:hypothetical protein